MHTFLCINWLMHTFHFVSTGTRAHPAASPPDTQSRLPREYPSEYEYVLAASPDVSLVWGANQHCTILLAALSLYLCPDVFSKPSSNPIGFRLHDSTKMFREHCPSTLCSFISALGGCNNARGYVMHSPTARALRSLERYCISSHTKSKPHNALGSVL